MSNLLYSKQSAPISSGVFPGRTRIYGVKGREMHYLNQDEFLNEPCLDNDFLGEFNYKAMYSRIDISHQRSPYGPRLVKSKEMQSTSFWWVAKANLSFNIPWRAYFVHKTVYSRTNAWMNDCLDYQYNNKELILLPVNFSFANQETRDIGAVTFYPRVSGLRLHDNSQIRYFHYHNGKPRQKDLAEMYAAFNYRTVAAAEKESQQLFDKRFTFLSALASVEDFFRQPHARWFYMPAFSKSYTQSFAHKGILVTQTNGCLVYISSQGKILGGAWVDGKEEIMEAHRIASEL